MNISRGKVERPQKVVLYGIEGIGKSTFAAKFPDVVFIDTEGSTLRLDVARTDKPTSWTMLLDQVKYFRSNPHLLKTLAIDTADWAESLCVEHICAKAKTDGLEGFGYGKGYTYLEEEFGRLLNLLEEVIEAGVNVVITAHACIKKFEQPDELGSYDRWELKLAKKCAPLLKEWADMVLFANYKTYVVNVDGQGAQKGKNKAQGNARVIFTSHTPSWDAKNRHDLAYEIPFDYSSIAHCIPVLSAKQVSVPIQQSKPVEPVAPLQEPSVQAPAISNDLDGVPKALADLMKANAVTKEEIQAAVSSKGYYPKDTPISKYDTSFINGVLVAAWAQVFKMIQNIREDSELKEKLGF